MYDTRESMLELLEGEFNGENSDRNIELHSLNFYSIRDNPIGSIFFESGVGWSMYYSYNDLRINMVDVYPSEKVMKIANKMFDAVKKVNGRVECKILTTSKVDYYATDCKE